MPKRSIEIPTCDGMLGVVDSRDLPSGAAAFCRDLDLVTESGAFVPLPADADTSHNPTGASWFAHLEDATTAIYTNGNAINSIVFSSGTIATAATGVNGGQTCGVSDGEAVHVGMGRGSTSKPYWVGNIYHGQFGGSAPSGIQGVEATLYNKSVYRDSTTANLTTDETEVYLSWQKKVFYYCTLVYDGVQESFPYFLGSYSIPLVTNPQFKGAKSIDIDIRAKVGGTTGDPSCPSDFIDLSPRVTRIKIYRGTAESYEATEPDGFYNLAASIDINDSGWSGQTSDTGTNFHQYTYTDAGEVAGGTFENEAGFSPSLEHMEIGYGLSATLDGYHIVGDIYHKDLKDLPNMLYRSLAHRYDTFDWSSYYLRLPTKPVALVGFNGRLYAFSSGRTYVIDANLFVVEDTWEGVGCYSRKSVWVSDRGMFWCDEQNIYHHDGTRIHIIGRPILKNLVEQYAGWETHVTTANTYPLLVYDYRYDSLIILYKRGDDDVGGFMYHVASGRWQYLTPYNNGIPGAAVHDENGRTYYTSGNDLIELFGAGTNRTWEWVSQDYARPGNKTKFYRAYLSHRGASDQPDVFFWENQQYSDTPTGALVGVASDGDVTRYTINNSANWNAARSFMMKLSGAANETATHVSIVHRTITPR